MERFSGILLGVWREACRHIEMGESAAILAPMLARHVPLAAVVVRRIDAAHAWLETVAVGSAQPHAPERLQAGEGNARAAAQTSLATGRTPCAPEQMRRLLAWCGRGHVLRRGRRRKLANELALILPPDLDADAMAGPLTGHDGPAGVLILVAREGELFSDAHAELVSALLEPFSAALENDRRLHEMTALREAAEADRRSLLTRLGRTELGDQIVGAASGLRPVMERVGLVAGSDAPVLIQGETGTGKELVARAIHNRSKRAAAPFIRVNCGAIPPELIDSQLFGHERGSFTGAVDTRQGWFERADAGTLFLDEIGELPLAAQVRLLRVLQDGYVERVGAQQPLRVDVRIVAATHRDLTAMVRDGRFREDLWYRIAVFPILLPPLRERSEDVPAMSCHFAERAATRFGLPLVMPSPEDLRVLTAYPWPGNVRELGAVIDRAAILGNGVRLEVVKALGVATPASPSVTAPSPAATVPPAAAPVTAATSPVLATASALAGASLPPPLHNGGASEAQPPPSARPAIDALDDAMRRHIESALAASLGRVEGPFGAAAALRINPHTLRSRMRKLGIDRKQFRSETLSLRERAG
jgi:transcriptional regulator with GAF, ATPase, and Fis domain